MIKKFLFFFQDRQFVFAPKIEYKLVVESAEMADKLREANQNPFRRRRKWFWRKSKRDFGFRKIAPYS